MAALFTLAIVNYAFDTIPYPNKKCHWGTEMRKGMLTMTMFTSNTTTFNVAL